jgi:hypothetical protein
MPQIKKFPISYRFRMLWKALLLTTAEIFFAVLWGLTEISIFVFFEEPLVAAGLIALGILPLVYGIKKISSRPAYKVCPQCDQSLVPVQYDRDENNAPIFLNCARCNVNWLAGRNRIWDF